MDLDLLAACEGLAANVHDEDDNSDLAADVERWMNLFGLGATEAEREIGEWRSSIGRNSLGSEAWESIKDRLEVKGFDKESYEYALATQRLPTTPGSAQADACRNSKVCMKTCRVDIIPLILENPQISHQYSLDVFRHISLIP